MEKPTRLRNWIEVVSALGVIAGLVLVAWERRRAAFVPSYQAFVDSLFEAGGASGRVTLERLALREHLARRGSPVA